MKKLFVIIFTLLIFISCDEIESNNCPENIKLQPPTNTGENIVACKIDGEVWIGNQAIWKDPWYGVVDYEPSFNIKENYLKDENGDYKLDSIYKIYFYSSYIYDCKELIKYSFSLDDFYLTISSKGTQPFNGKLPFIKFTDYTNSDSPKYHYMDFDKPYKLKVSLDTALGIASGTFSGIFTDYETGKELEITDGFFDMKEGMPDDR